MMHNQQQEQLWNTASLFYRELTPSQSDTHAAGTHLQPRVFNPAITENLPRRKQFLSTLEVVDEEIDDDTNKEVSQSAPCCLPAPNSTSYTPSDQRNGEGHGGVLGFRMRDMQGGDVLGSILEWCKAQEASVHSFGEQMQEKMTRSQIATARIGCKIQVVREYFKYQVSFKDTVHKLLSEAEHALNLAQYEKDMLYEENKQLKTQVETFRRPLHKDRTETELQSNLEIIKQLQEERDRLEVEYMHLKETNTQLSRKLSASLKNKVELEREQHHRQQLDLQLKALARDNEELEIRVRTLARDLETAEVQRRRCTCSEACHAQIQEQIQVAPTKAHPTTEHTLHSHVSVLSVFEDEHKLFNQMESNRLEAEKMLVEFRIREQEWSGKAGKLAHNR